MKLNPEIKAKWLELIKKYDDKQCFNSLRKNDCYCILGLLCLLHSKIHNIDWTVCTDKDKTKYWNSHNYIGCSCTLPSAVKNWLNLTTPFIYVEYKREQVSLNSLNDEKVPFKKLYRLIEEQL